MNSSNDSKALARSSFENGWIARTRVLFDPRPLFPPRDRS